MRDIRFFTTLLLLLLLSFVRIFTHHSIARSLFPVKCYTETHTRTLEAFQSRNLYDVRPATLELVLVCAFDVQSIAFTRSFFIHHPLKTSSHVYF